MVLTFLLDENIRASLFRAIQRHNHSSQDRLDVVRVGHSSDLPLSSDDPAILRWIEQEGRILVTEDKHTIPGHLKEHLEAGRHSPGVFLVRPGTSIPALLEFLVLVAHASKADEWRDRIEFIP